MKLGILTSSRADYGIYKPLLDRLKSEPNISIHIITFGMHLLHSQGNTLSIIESDGYENISIVGEMSENDDVYDVAKGYAKILYSFIEFWNSNKFDLVFALGDRWEMSAAVQASIPFQTEIAHIHGGETTLGALDNIYRHQISLASKIHFTATDQFSERVYQITGSTEGIITTGSISLSSLESIKLPKWEAIQEKFKISFKNFVLVTVHPESVLINRNSEYAQICYDFLKKLALTKNILITKANSDALGSLYNKKFVLLQNQYPGKIKLISSMGKLNYFKAMQQCEFMIGNTSSGIVEAASFKKWVLNIGERQAGRLRNLNVIDVPFDKEKIESELTKIATLGPYEGGNQYRKPRTCDIILDEIRMRYD